MKKTKIFTLASALLLTACTPDNTPYQDRISFFAMDTYMEITAYGHADTSLTDCKEEIQRLEALLSVTDENSEISKINASGVCTVSPDTAAIINCALQIGAETDGALDITVYPILKEWGFTASEYHVPDSETLSALLQNADYTQVKLDGNNVTVPDSVQLDLGALAKGYASDKAAEILKDKGIDSALINLGGNIMTIGSNPSSGSPWCIGIRNPFSLDENIGVVEVADKAVVTSGSYERCFTAEDGTTYHHIIDPATGCPARSGLVSVTVIGDSGIKCDALSTALFVMGAEGAEDYYHEKGDFDMILVTEEREIIITERIADSFVSLTEMRSIVIRD